MLDSYVECYVAFGNFIHTYLADSERNKIEQKICKYIYARGIHTYHDVYYEENFSMK